MPSLIGIRQIAEQSVLATFTNYASSFPGVSLNAGLSDQIRTLPTIIFAAQSVRSHPDFGGTPVGNFEVTLTIYVYTSADDETKQTHIDRVEAVQGIMQDVATLQSNWTQGTLNAAWIVSNESEYDDRRWGDALIFNLVCVYPPA